MSLQFNVSMLLQEEVGAMRQHTIDSRVLIGDEPSHGRVMGKALLLRTKEGVLVSAELAGQQHEQCSRCLVDMEAPLEIKFQEEFVLQVDPVTGATLPQRKDPDTFLIDTNYVLDVEEAVRQSWMAALPMQPLCRLDCAGLCPTCGQDLNQQPCCCQPEPEDRWGALREVAQEMKGS